MNPHRLPHTLSYPRGLLAGLCLLLVASLLPSEPGRSGTAHAAPLAPSPATVTPTVRITYPSFDGFMPNPERGFYRDREVRTTDLTPYDPDDLAQLRGEGVRLVGCIHYLYNFVTSPLSDAYLTLLTTNFARVRAAGLKCILRFAYTDDDPTLRGEAPPFGDATQARILAHIAQLEPVLRANADVIAHVQAGFIGVWGEWYYTDHFVDDPAVPWDISAAQYARRLTVLSALLDALPTTRTVAIRYPFAKRLMYATDDPGSAATAHNGSDRARVGFHNDCFLASPTDYGTFRSDQLAADKTYLAAATRYLPMGGESCAPNPPRTDCPTALDELARFHWSYLSRDYHPDILAGWQSQGCMADIARGLGYRLALQTGDFPTQAAAGGPLPVAQALVNQGFAAPFNPRPVELVLRHVQTRATHAVALPVDPRFWLPNVTQRIAHTVTLPATLPLGQYELLLHLPDPAAGLRARPDYAIRFANQGTWEATTGYNRLNHTITVVAPAPTHTLHLPALMR